MSELLSPQLDVRGPVHVEGRRVVVSKQDVQAEALEPHLTKKCPGKGAWIWSGSERDSVPVRFRKKVLLKAKPSKARIWVTAEAKYRLWVNGRLAARGPADVGRDYDSGPCGPWMIDQRDVAEFLTAGENVLAVEVFPLPLVQSESTTGHPGLRLDLQIPGAESVKSDTSWQVSQANDLDQRDSSGAYVLDMRKEPEGWQFPGFDDSAWTFARVVDRQNWTTLSELPPLMEAKVSPSSAKSRSESIRFLSQTGLAKVTSDGECVVNFGHVLSGYVGMHIRGVEGAKVGVMPNEVNQQGWHRKAEVTLRDGDQYFELPYFDSFSVINLAFQGVTNPITVHDVSAVFTSFPVSYQGSFRSSDPLLDRFWKICRWETQICMQTHHLDSPHHQEPICDPGDYLIEALNSYFAFGESRLAKQDLKKYASLLQTREYKPFHTSYALLWLRMLVVYQLYTGDSKTVRELAPVVFDLIAQFASYLGPRGIISEAPNYMFLDWVEMEGFNLHHPPCVIGQGCMTAFFVQALADAARVATLAGDTERSKAFGALRAKTAASFVRELWDEGSGQFLDGRPFQTSIKPNDWLPPDQDIQTHSTQVNALAVWSGIVEGKEAKSLMERVMNRPDLNCQPYFMHFVFEALDKADLFDRFAVPQMKRWQIVPDSQTFYEMWDRGDLSHAWNGALLHQLSRRVLGVEPTKAGFKEFKISPHSCGLEWAQGAVPTPKGLIEMSWRINGNGLLCEFTVPPGTRATIGRQGFPVGHHQVRFANGKVTPL